MDTKHVFKHVLLTGTPGIGKTTTIKKICELLSEKNININGFFTEEVRGGRGRVGFDIVTLSGVRGILARIGNNTRAKDKETFIVGRYVVSVKSFQELALPVFEPQLMKNSGVLVLDEIGRMELFCEPFKKEVEIAINSSRVILATIPIGKNIPFVEWIRNHPTVKVVVVNMNNRNFLAEQITEMIIAAL